MSHVSSIPLLSLSHTFIRPHVHPILNLLALTCTTPIPDKNSPALGVDLTCIFYGPYYVACGSLNKCFYPFWRRERCSVSRNRSSSIIFCQYLWPVFLKAKSHIRAKGLYTGLYTGKLLGLLNYFITEMLFLAILDLNPRSIIWFSLIYSII